MNIFTIKTQSVLKLVGFIFAALYGVFVIYSLQRLYLLGSGDINAYVDFFDNIDIYTTFNEYSIRGDGVFRLTVVFLSDFFNLEILTVLSALAFIMSTTIFSIYLNKIKSGKYLVYILPVFILVFLTPMVANLFASGIRSGIAFTILTIAILHSRGIVRISLFVLSGLIHLSMLPIIAMFFLFYSLQKIRIRSPFIIPLFILSSFTLLIALGSYLFGFNVTKVSSSAFFNTVIFCLALLLIFTNKKSIRNIFGFLSIGLILIYLFGLLIDLSFIRYVGNAIIFYLLFLIERGGKETIQVFTFGYIPFFFLTSLYALSNTL